MNVNNDYEIKMTDENASYIKYHRDNILLNKKFYIIANEVYKDRVIIINEKL